MSASSEGLPASSRLRASIWLRNAAAPAVNSWRSASGMEIPGGGIWAAVRRSGAMIEQTKIKTTARAQKAAMRLGCMFWVDTASWCWLQESLAVFSLYRRAAHCDHLIRDSLRRLLQTAVSALHLYVRPVA